jgi:hypothetical protein
MINVGDKVYLGHNGEVRAFRIYRILDEVVVLTWTHENVVQLKRVPRAKLLGLILRGA